MKGYIYLIKASSNPPRYKIGRTRDIEKRFKRLKECCPFPLKLERWKEVKDMMVAERVLHERMDKYRVWGEWFVFPHNILLSIDDWFFKEFPRLPQREIKDIEEIEELDTSRGQEIQELDTDIDITDIGINSLDIDMGRDKAIDSRDSIFDDYGSISQVPVLDTNTVIDIEDIDKEPIDSNKPTHKDITKALDKKDINKKDSTKEDINKELLIKEEVEELYNNLYF